VWAALQNDRQAGHFGKPVFYLQYMWAQLFRLFNGNSEIQKLKNKTQK
jgi:hypothetical protein